MADYARWIIVILVLECENVRLFMIWIDISGCTKTGTGFRLQKAASIRMSRLMKYSF